MVDTCPAPNSPIRVTNRSASMISAHRSRSHSVGTVRLVTLTLEDLTVPAPPPSAADWNSDGVVLMKSFMAEKEMSKYEKHWLKHNRDRPGGWHDPVPYMRHKEVLNFFSYGPLAELLESLIGEPAGVHLNLTGWRSTERDWHQDSYLNPEHVGDFYAAAWIALDDISPDSGPFQYIPGSHRWPQVTREKILSALEPHERDHIWTKHSERILTPLFEAEIAKSGSDVVTHTPSRGDVLIWHGRLMHRGSLPRVPGMERRSAIAHYSGINHRPDMPAARRTKKGGWYFPIEIDLKTFYG